MKGDLNIMTCPCTPGVTDMPLLLTHLCVEILKGHCSSYAGLDSKGSIAAATLLQADNQLC